MSGPAGRAAGASPGPSAGLCGACRHARQIETRTGSVFWRCERSIVDPAYPRYPALPMVRCLGFERLEPDTVTERA